MQSTPEERWLDRVTTEMVEMSPHMATVAASLNVAVRAVLMRARSEATQRDHLSVDTEHLLLGMLRFDDNAGVLALQNMGIDLLRLRSGIDDAINAAGYQTRAGGGGLTKLAYSALTIAWDEMQEQIALTQQLGPGHLLLGLWREGGGIAARVLARSGASLEQARVQVIEIAGGRVAEPALKPGPKGNVVACRLDPVDADTLDALVDAGMHATRGEAASWLLHAGIEASQTTIAHAAEIIAQIDALRHPPDKPEGMHDPDESTPGDQ